MNKWEDLFNEEEFCKDLSFLLSIPSVMDADSSDINQPFGKEVQRALEFMLRLGEMERLSTYQHNGYYGYMEFGPEDAEDYIAVLCHVDVVPASGEWTNDPFDPQIKDNRIYARGAIDDKGPTMACLVCFENVENSWYLDEASYSLDNWNKRRKRNELYEDLCGKLTGGIIWICTGCRISDNSRGKRSD